MFRISLFLAHSLKPEPVKSFRIIINILDLYKSGTKKTEEVASNELDRVVWLPTVHKPGFQLGWRSRPRT